MKLKEVKLTADIKFIIILIGISFLYNFQNIIKYPPYSTHYWRQADAYSIAVNYYKEGMNFFEPKIHHQASIEGRGVGEFPIIYYINACIWKITSLNFVTFRLLNLLITFLGLFFLFKTAMLVLKDFFWSCAISLVVLSSPLFVFYSNNFMANAAILGLMFIAWYFFALFSIRKKNKYLWFSVLFMTLSVLLRATMIIGVLPVVLLLFLELVGILKSNVFYKKVMHLPMLLLPVILLVVWVLYSKHYNEVNESGYFLTTIRPAWNAPDVNHIWSAFYNNVLPEFHFHGMLFIISSLLLGLIITFKKQNKYLIIFTLTLSVELVLYLVLWFANLEVHDYYLIELFLIVPPLFIGFFLFLKNENPNIFNSKKLKIAVMIILLFYTYSCAIKERYKYDSYHPMFGAHIILTEDQVERWAFCNWDYDCRLNSFRTITPYIRSLGIKRNDLVISLPDISPNVSLSLMDQKGYTSLYYSELSEGERIRLYIKKGAKYLFINDSKLYDNPEIAPFTRNKIGQYQNIDIFDLRGLALP